MEICIVRVPSARAYPKYRGSYDNRRGYFRISARRWYSNYFVAKPPDVTVAIRNGDLIGPSELALAFTFTGVRSQRLDGWRGRTVIVVAFERFVAVRGA